MINITALANINKFCSKILNHLYASICKFNVYNLKKQNIIQLNYETEFKYYLMYCFPF